MKLNKLLLIVSGIFALMGSAGAQQYIQPVSISSDDTLTSGSFTNMIDNTSIADYSPNYVWKGESYGTLTFSVDLGDDYDVSELYFWNYNSTSLMTVGIDLDFKDASGTSVGTWSGDPTIGTYVAAAGYTSQTLDITDYSNVRTVDFVLTGSASGTKFCDVGFGGVTTVPEPSSAALLGLGGVAMLLRRRR